MITRTLYELSLFFLRINASLEQNSDPFSGFIKCDHWLPDKSHRLHHWPIETSTAIFRYDDTKRLLLVSSSMCCERITNKKTVAARELSGRKITRSKIIDVPISNNYFLPQSLARKLFSEPITSSPSVQHQREKERWKVPDFSFFPPSDTNLYCECQSGPRESLWGAYKK